MSSKRSSRKLRLPNHSPRLEGDPGTYFDPAHLSETPHHKNERKTAQLCEQVAEAISFALAECHNPLLSGLVVESVHPAPSASRLRVVVSGPALDGVGIVEALDTARGFLRRQVAAEIHRKRVPELRFVFIAEPSDEEAPS